ncbi:MAG TPA: hypothetical protein VFF67_00690 [Thermoplasmata archaeon]|nr:hypothetical protein [Thermoplasmata archaeon]
MSGVPAILAAAIVWGAAVAPGGIPGPSGRGTGPPIVAAANGTVVANFSDAVGRLVTLVGAAGAGLLALVWTRVAFSWFSNDLGKKIQAKDRARDALVGTLLFVAAITGLVWALARWVVSGRRPAPSDGRMTDWNQVVQAILFGIFAGLTAVLAAILGPTYDNLVVPQLLTSALYPPWPTGAPGAGSFLGFAAGFSAFLLVRVVDPAVALVAVAVGMLYLLRATSSRLAARLSGFLPRLLVAVLLANFALPVAGAVFRLAGALYPEIAGYDGGAWQHWVNLAGPGEVAFSWDNGALAFVLTFVLFSLVLLLGVVVAARDALLAVLVVLLPLATLLWPLPILGQLARRAWLLFVELAFLPCVLIVPLELAVGAPNILLLLGYLTIAVSAPSLLSLAGAQLASAGFPSGGAVLTGGIQRGLAVASLAGSSYLRPLIAPGRGGGAGPAASSMARTTGSASLPASIPVLTAEALGWGAHHVFRHLARGGGGRRSLDRFGPVRKPSNVRPPPGGTP